MTTQQPILIEENKLALNELDANINYGKEVLTEVLKEWYLLTNQYLTIEQLSGFFGTNTRDFLVPKYDFIQGLLLDVLVATKLKLVEASGLEVSPLKLREIICVPEVKALNKQLERLIYAPTVNVKEIVYWQAYTVKNGEVNIIPEVHEQLKNQFRSWATTELQKARLLKAQQLCDLLNSIYETFPDSFDSNIQLEIFGVARLDRETQKLVPASGFVSYTLATIPMPATGFEFKK